MPPCGIPPFLTGASVRLGRGSPRPHPTGRLSEWANRLINSDVLKHLYYVAYLGVIR
jgi:hypothetical protein